MAVRNCLECRQRQRDRSCKSSLTSSKSQDSLYSAPPSKVTHVHNPRALVHAQNTRYRDPREPPGRVLLLQQDPDRLLQDVDINRLRAVVFRDVVRLR